MVDVVDQAETATMVAEDPLIAADVVVVDGAASSVNGTDEDPTVPLLESDECVSESIDSTAASGQVVEDTPVSEAGEDRGKADNEHEAANGKNETEMPARPDLSCDTPAAAAAAVEKRDGTDEDQSGSRESEIDVSVPVLDDYKPSDGAGAHAKHDGLESIEEDTSANDENPEDMQADDKNPPSKAQGVETEYEHEHVAKSESATEKPATNVMPVPAKRPRPSRQRIALDPPERRPRPATRVVHFSQTRKQSYHRLPSHHHPAPPSRPRIPPQHRPSTRQDIEQPSSPPKYSKISSTKVPLPPLPSIEWDRNSSDSIPTEPTATYSEDENLSQIVAMPKTEGKGKAAAKKAVSKRRKKKKGSLALFLLGCVICCLAVLIVVLVLLLSTSVFVGDDSIEQPISDSRAEEVASPPTVPAMPAATPSLVTPPPSSPPPMAPTGTATAATSSPTAPPTRMPTKLPTRMPTKMPVMPTPSPALPLPPTLALPPVDQTVDGSPAPSSLQEALLTTPASTKGTPMPQTPTPPTPTGPPPTTPTVPTIDDTFAPTPFNDDFFFPT